jgi:uncharacterized protein YegL
VVLLWTFVLLLGPVASSTARAQCLAACPANAVEQIDGCGEETPDPNGGCAAGPGKFQPLGTLTPVELGIACGTVGATATGTVDLDAYSFHLAMAATVQLDLVQQDPDGAAVRSVILQLFEGTECTTQTLRYAAAVSVCPFTSDPVTLPAGEHLITITVGALDGAAPPPCPVSYRLLALVVQQVPPSCAAASASCCIVSSVGGCADLTCCAQVCEVDSACCDLAWDLFCVISASTLCGLCDCNANGVLDLLDIESGSSEDCDLNGQPDECAVDCDGNGSADSCDIAADPSLDADGDGFIDGCVCGCLDLVLAVDVTGSMDGAIASVQNGLAQVLAAAEAVAESSLRAALITFTDQVRVVQVLTPSIGMVEASVLLLESEGGASLPEASDEAIRTVLSTTSDCLASGSQFFHTALRQECRRLIILVTDAVPGGCDDTFTPGVDDLTAQLLAEEAAAAGIEIAAVFVPTSGVNGTTLGVMTNYATITGGILATTGANGAGTAEALAEAIIACRSRGCAGDLDGDGSIGGADLGMLLAAWSSDGSPPPQSADLDGSGSVDGADLGLLLSGWGPCR